MESEIKKIIIISKLLDLKLISLVTTININGLYIPIKANSKTGGLKQGPNTCYRY